MTKIEEVARAMLAELQRQADGPGPSPLVVDNGDIKNILIDGRVDLLAAAIAAVSAMRDPNKFMLQNCDSSLVYAEIAEVHNSLLDAALAEHKE